MNLVENKQDERIYIEVRDLEGFLERKFALRIQKMLEKSANTYIKSNELKYCFIEAESHRNISFESNYLRM